MKKKNRTPETKRRAVSLVCAAAIFLLLLIQPFTGGTIVSARGSLPYIDDLVQRFQGGGTFSILEIIPQPGTGSLGYYVAGQEPNSAWREHLSALSSPAERSAYMSGSGGLFAALESSGLMGNGSDTPLTKQASYTEKHMWDSDAAGYSVLPLDHSETVQLNAEMTAVPENTGSFRAEYAYNPVPDGTGDHILDVHYFIAEEYDLSDPPPFYYLPSFTLLPGYTEPVGGAGTAIYAVTDLNGRSVFEYVGTWGDADLELDSAVDYYYIDGLAAYGQVNPGGVSGGDVVYIPQARASGDGYSYVGDGAGYYVREKTGKYFWSVTDGVKSGDHELTALASSETVEIEYNQVLYIGGYVNNNWFLKYVFDMDYPSSSTMSEADYFAQYDLRVNTVTASQVTATMVTDADFVVLSRGYSPEGAAIAAYDASNDISAAAAYGIYTMASSSANLPVVVDYRVASSGTDTNIRKLARFLIGASAGYTASAAGFGDVTVPGTWDPSNKNHVDGNIYCYNPGSGAPGYSALATQYFRYNFISNTAAGLGFTAVTDEISNENFLKETAGDPYRLPVELTMANIMRYIINYGNQRSINAKTALKVLEIQPRNGTQLTADMVYSWLPADSAINKDNIEIVPMSTSQFIGRIEDLNETYDMIYIGDSTAGFPLSGGTTVFNDGNMNGLLYYNIGDKFTLDGFPAAGQLNREYHGSNRNNNILNNVSAREYRFPGNDITARAAQMINDFAVAGYPVVFADSLMASSGTASRTVTFTANATAGEIYYSSNRWRVNLSAEVVTDSGVIPDGATYSYQWYQVGGGTLNNSTSSTYAFSTQNSTFDQTYYCRVRVRYNGTDYYAESNRLTVLRTTTASTVISSSDNDKTTGTISEATPTISVVPGISGSRNSSTYAATFTGSVTNDSTIKSTLGSAGYTNITYRYTLQRATSSDFSRGLYTVATSNNSQGASYTFDPQNRPSSSIGSYYYRILIEVYSNGTKISAGTGDAITQYCQHDYYSSRTNGRLTGPSGSALNGTVSYTVNNVSLNIGVTPVSGTASNTQSLTASVSTSPSTSGLSYTYRWYTDRPGASNPVATTSNTSTSNSYSVTRTQDIQMGTPWQYYCTVTVNGVTSRSNTVILTRQGATQSVTDIGGGTYNSITTTTPVYTTQGDVNGARVDNCTYLYSTMNSIKGRSNVVTVYEALSNKRLFLSYINLSKPQINLTSFPTEYAITAETSTSITMTSLAPVNGVYVLRYEFTISNDTDPTPASTTYDCKLYVDANSDGRYGSDEVLGDVVVRRASTGTLMIKSQGKYTLKAGEEYIVTRQMPADYVGILPWQLQVIKNGAEHIHASVHSYTRIAPSSSASAKEIKVLQVAAGSNTVLVESQSTYTTLINKVNASGDFNIDISTVYNSGTRYKNYGAGKTTPEWSTNANSTTIYNVLQEYDMLIIGFNDCYDGVNEALADAIFTYIDSGKAVLFTHDTTSFSNTANADVKIQGTSNNARGGDTHWGYYFNTVLRASVGLDYYGISDSTVIGGGSNLSSLLRASNTNVNTISNLQLANGYNVAYTPKSDKASLLDYTHGYTPYFLVSKGSTNTSNNRSYTSNMDGIHRTTQVTQTNEGQITTYPFNINTAAFGGSGNYLNVALTHEQYYQLNMNHDDIVVWYCLGYNENTSPGYSQVRSSYGNIRNDVSNAYYIYTMGNVTYSGVGHASGVTNDEAKLFINTMIAASRTSSSIPAVSIRNQDNMEADYMYFTALNEGGELIEKEYGPTDESRAVYFSFVDANLVGNKVITAEFFYSASSSTVWNNLDTTAVKIEPTVYLANGGASGSLAGGVLYKFFLPDSVLNAFENSDSRYAFRVFIRITTTVNGTPLTGENSVDSIRLARIGLLTLS